MNAHYRTVPAQWIRLILGCLVVGLATGEVMLAVKVAVEESTKKLLDWDPWMISATLVIGAVATVLIVRYLAGASPSTTDRYIEQFHDDPRPVDIRNVPGRLLASVTTGASGIPRGRRSMRERRRRPQPGGGCGRSRTSTCTRCSSPGPPPARPPSSRRH